MSTANVILPFFVGEGETLFVLLPSKSSSTNSAIMFLWRSDDAFKRAT